MLTFDDILYGTAVPFAVALAVLLIGWRPWRRDRSAAGFDGVTDSPGDASGDARREGANAEPDTGAAIAARPGGAWAGPVAIGAAFAAGYLGLFGRPALPPASVSQWVVFLAVPLVAIGLLDALARVPAWLTAVLVVAATCGGGWLTLQRLVPGTFETTGALATYVAALAVPALVWWLALDGLAARLPGAGAPLVFLVVATGAAVVLGTSGSKTVGQTAGLLPAALAAAVIVGWWPRAPVLARGAAVPFVGLALTVLTYARFYLDPPAPAVNLLLLLVAPPLAWLADQAVGRRLIGWKRTLVVVGAAFVPLAVATALSIATFIHEMGQTTYDGYSY